jgi:hypothetical protein
MRGKILLLFHTAALFKLLLYISLAMGCLLFNGLDLTLKTPPLPTGSNQAIKADGY